MQIRPSDQDKSHTDEPDERTLPQDVKSSKWRRFRTNCSACCARIRIPSWLAKPLFWLYTHLGGPVTYVLLLCAFYATVLALKPSLALPPLCRRIAIPVIQPNQTEPDYQFGMECQRGEVLSILIFYAFGFLFGEIMESIHLPGLLGMLLGGLCLRNIGGILIPETIYRTAKLPNGSFPVPMSATNETAALFIGQTLQFDRVDLKTQMAALLLVNPALSGVLRQLALTTILSRAGLGIDPATLKQVCGSVFRLTFIPCICEAMTLMLVSRFLIGWPWAWGAILGFVCAAVSPAVIVPNMMRLEVTGWGVAEGIPTLVVAASSLDDVVAITGFGVALAVALSTGTNLVSTLFWGPAEALIGALFGAVVGSLLCLFPPPKLQHSHLIRGLLLMCMAVTGLVGSVGLHLPGAGALSCLTLAFVVANGWRHGFPWRLTQSDYETGMLDVEESHNISNRDTTTSGTKKNSNSNPSNSKPKKSDKPEPASAPSQPKSSSEVTTELDNLSRKSLETSKEAYRHHPRGSGSSRILETLVEYHPYYCSILRQQYGNMSSEEQSLRGSIRSGHPPHLGKHMRLPGDLPALAVAVAATGTERKDSRPMGASIHAFKNRPRASRRFSLPEPTAHYELESFSVPSPLRHGLHHHLANQRSNIRRRLLSPTFAEQYAAIYNQTVDQVLEEQEEEEEDYEDDQQNRQRHDHHQQSNAITDKSEDRKPNEVRRESRRSSTSSTSSASVAAAALPATPEERGLACLNSIRSTVAAIWWFVQPILFSLIGSEVNVLSLRGPSTGRGLAAFLISLCVRLGATIVAVLPSDLNMKERLFIGFAWLPKATVQAAVGPVALDTARQLNASPEIIGYGEQVITIAAISILITAPLGAILMPLTAPYLLKQDLGASQVLIERTSPKPPIEHKQEENVRMVNRNSKSDITKSDATSSATNANVSDSKDTTFV